MKTQDEILLRIEEVKKHDFFGAQTSDLMDFLVFENAKKFLKAEATEEQWKEVYTEPTRENIIKKINDYLPFAFEKARNERGLSAARSMDHMKAWLWMLGDDEMVRKCNCYRDYGTPQLEEIKEKYGFKTPSLQGEVNEMVR